MYFCDLIAIKAHFRLLSIKLYNLFKFLNLTIIYFDMQILKYSKNNEPNN